MKGKGKKAETFKFVELFAGIGGFRYALDALGAECVMASEVSGECRERYMANFGKDEPLLGDINLIEADLIPKYDI
jgi:DNA (cytosine-5)-methyltransferase 1